MSSDADAHKVGLIPVTLRCRGILWGQVFFCYLQTWPPWRDCHLWMVGDDYRCAGALEVYAKMSFLDPSPGGSYAYAPAALARFSVIKPTSSTGWPADRQYRHGGHWRRIFKLLLPDLKDPLVLTITCVVVLWIFVR